LETNNPNVSLSNDEIEEISNFAARARAEKREKQIDMLKFYSTL